MRAVSQQKRVRLNPALIRFVRKLHLTNKETVQVANLTLMDSRRILSFTCDVCGCRQKTSWRQTRRSRQFSVSIKCKFDAAVRLKG